MASYDPLKIYYYVVLATDEPTAVTPFQGFSRSWRHNHWALMLLPTLPGDVLERGSDFKQILAQRMGGLRSLHWMPLSLRALEKLSLPEMGVFVVLFTGEHECALRVADWTRRQPRPLIHVTSQNADGAISPDQFSASKLKAYCAEALKSSRDCFSDEQLDAADTALVSWKEPDLIPAGITAHGHNVLIPNHLSLLRASRSCETGRPYAGEAEAEYTEKILESAAAVRQLREEVGLHPVHLLSLLRPGLILAEPSLFRTHYHRVRTDGSRDARSVGRTIRFFQSQRGLFNQSDTLHDDFATSSNARGIAAMRRSELETFTLGVGLFAAQTVSAVVRLSPGVNHAFPALSNYARNIRSNRIEARLKTPRLFRAVQQELTKAVGKDRLKFIVDEPGPIKIISDAPIEWLPTGNLPMCLRYNCSRINATPGNLLMNLLTERPPAIIPPQALRKILVISTFSDDDPIKEFLAQSLDVAGGHWRDGIDVSFVRATTLSEFVDALNRFDGSIVVFDGHGVDNADQPIGKLAIGGEQVDVWGLRGKVRVPPIVILSACDTHGIDASSQATVGNGFLALGAQTVVATLLPVSAAAAALFIGRLFVRIADFVPAALDARGRGLSWSEVISGMLRMSLASEVLNNFVGPPTGIDQPRGQLQLQANEDINVRNSPSWFDDLLVNIADYKQVAVDRIASRADALIARSEAIRYIQLGHPDAIVIADEAIVKRIEAIYASPPTSAWLGNGDDRDAGAPLPSSS